jgi:hypothetical protein
MDQAAMLLGALRVKAKRDGTRLSTAEVESLADAVAIQRSALPGLIAALQAAGHVTLVWGGLELTAAPAPTGERIGIGAGTAGPGIGPTMTVRAEFRLGELAAVRQQLQPVAPRLHGVAAESAREALAVLDAHPVPDAPAEARRAWAARLMDALNELVRRAPESEAVLDLAERAQRAVGRA